MTDAELSAVIADMQHRIDYLERTIAMYDDGLFPILEAHKLAIQSLENRLLAVERATPWKRPPAKRPPPRPR